MNKEKLSKWDRMSAAPIRSAEWFAAAFEDMEHVPDFCKQAAKSICNAYPIAGQCDPGYIANVINSEYNKSNGEYTLQEFRQELNAKHRIPSGVKKVLLTFADIEIQKTETVNCQQRIVLKYFDPIQLLMQIDGNIQLWWVDNTGNPTRPSYFYLPEPLDFD